MTGHKEKEIRLNLVIERATYEEYKQALLALVPGKFVLIKGSEIICKRDSYEEAAMEGLERFRGEDFLVKEVLEEDHTYALPHIALAKKQEEFTTEKKRRVRVVNSSIVTKKR